ncbi:MAG: glycoside-pentoside-hexuronide (GPH):cation symporter [Propionibacteriaceae bacterium]|nr:MFS transporter [Micropruina sp.]
MTATETPSAHLGALEKLPTTSILGYGLGDFAMNLSFAMSTSFLLYYFTDVGGLSAAAVGTMFLVVRLWDAFTDLFAGRVVDKTMTRWGKFRPFLLWFAVPVLFLSFLNFNIPTQGVKWLGIFEVNPDATAQLLYAYLAYAILGLLYSLINIPYGALASAMTQSVNERAKLVAARAFGAAIGGVLLTYIVAPQISAIQKTAPKLAANADAAAKAAYQTAVLAYRQNVQSVFTLTTLLFVLVGSIAFFLTFWWCRESVVRTSPKVTIKETVETLKQNKPLAYLCAASLFYLVGLFAVGGSTAFYAKYVLGDISQTANMVLVNSGIALLITPIIPWIIRKMGKKNVFQWCGLFTIIGGVALFFVPTGAVAMALIFLAVKGIGASLINTVMFGLEADTVEYGEWKSGKRSEGATYAIFSFTRKVTQSIGGAMGAWLLAIGGYLSATATDPNPTQPESAIVAIKFTIGLLPAICAVIAMLIFWKYPLTDKLFQQIRDENEAKKAKLGADFHGAATD